MHNFREELDEVLKIRESGSGFHYAHKAQQLGQTAQQARQFSSLLKTPIGRWSKTLSDTRYVIDELSALGVSWSLEKS